MKILLERYGVSYEMVSDGIEAVEAFKQGGFDMILMDEQMPHMNGREAMAHIVAYEKEQGLEHVPIVAITANVVKGVKEQGMAAGYSAFLGKPVFFKELEAVFEHYLRERDATSVRACPATAPCGTSIGGLDMAKLQKELMLERDDIVMLLKVFAKKVASLEPELEAAIKGRDYAKVAKLAHSIKGSSANFRMETVQKLAKALEDAASNRTDDFDYEGCFAELTGELLQVKQVEGA